MIERCAAQIISDGTVTEIIVGEADWANEFLGGTWIQCERDYDNPENDTYPKIGDKWDFDKEIFVKSDSLENQVAKMESAKEKLIALGLSEEDIKALFA